MSLIDDLISVANHYGASAEFSRAGGGNVSAKVDGTLWIKPSGLPLAGLSADDLVELRSEVLQAALSVVESDEKEATPAAVTAALLDAPGGRRPSLAFLLHALIPDPLVLHLHARMANLLTCNTHAQALVDRLLGDEAILIPYTENGLPLARRLAAERAAYTERTGRPAPALTLLGNHGIIVSGDSAEEVSARVDRLTAVIAAAVEATEPEAAPMPVRDPALITRLAPTVRGLLGVADRLPVVASDSSELVRQVTLTAAGKAVCQDGPVFPDQVVYAGSLPLVVAEDADFAALASELDRYRQRHGRDPIIVVVPGQAAFGVGADLAAAQNALMTFTDALRVARDANRLGQVRPLTQAERTMIENSEDESYRKTVVARPQTGRMAGKIVMVTGAAQGFGLGIATELASQDATVVLADLNLELAQRNADELVARHGAGRAVAVRVDVSDEQSQLDAAAEVVARFGGLDVFISNAGVLRAEGVMTQPVADFDLVTNVNYRGYFLGVRAVAPIMAAQHRGSPQALFDIIEINSKSGLEGSKRNFAYAGSKFGGIGLTQSFALELIEDGIKVNAVCPGNYLDGPLWTDPERGLFVQYLKAGKVPGATTVEQVRAFYEAKVPMGRGCLPSDLATAIYYIVDQRYETGQAVPVTGGQNMLN